MKVTRYIAEGQRKSQEKPHLDKKQINALLCGGHIVNSEDEAVAWVMDELEEMDGYKGFKSSNYVIRTYKVEMMFTEGKVYDNICIDTDNK